MKFKYYKEKFEYGIRDVYYKHGFGHDEPYSADFQYGVASLIKAEAEKRGLPYRAEIIEIFPEWVIRFSDEKGNKYSEENEPEEVAALLEEMDKWDYSKVMDTLEKEQEKREREERRKREYEKEPEEIRRFLDSLESGND